ncbi:hypothetical protein B0T22DRAFT_467975 [Podospora appendiculata]|uniref:Uncharacterized protein n=1 Tax=Podospora appendiculata TaxID=314037 RepID=A0AAE1C8X0_9PEZI|nr:hypothetical protein B0T22DRAFT_467975 [Podospora appendiculata]
MHALHPACQKARCCQAIAIIAPSGALPRKSTAVIGHTPRVTPAVVCILDGYERKNRVCTGSMERQAQDCHFLLTSKLETADQDHQRLNNSGGPHGWIVLLVVQPGNQKKQRTTTTTKQIARPPIFRPGFVIHLGKDLSLIMRECKSPAEPDNDTPCHHSPVSVQLRCVCP